MYKWLCVGMCACMWASMCVCVLTKWNNKDSLKTEKLSEDNTLKHLHIFYSLTLKAIDHSESINLTYKMMVLLLLRTLYSSSPPPTLQIKCWKLEVRLQHSSFAGVQTDEVKCTIHTERWAIATTPAITRTKIIQTWSWVTWESDRVLDRVWERKGICWENAHFSYD